MKILVFTSLFPNHLDPDFGVFIKNRMLSVAQLKGCEIIVVAPVPYCPPWKILGKWYRFSKIQKHEKLKGIDVYHPRYLLIPKISMRYHGLSMYFFSIGLLKRIYKKFVFDIIDAHYIYPDGFAGVMLGRKFNIPVVVSARGSDIHDFPRFKAIKPLIQRTLSMANHVISVCNALKDAMVRLGCDSKKIKVISNGIDADRFFMLPRNLAREKLNLDQDKKIILSVGSLIPLKGHHLTIEAMQDILRDIPAAHLYIAGKGEKEENLKKQVLENGLLDHVSFLGHVANEELNQWYSAADVFCLASSREGWANVIMESMACGTPVVATNVWGAPEIITNEKVGILVERSVDAISRGLIDALNRDWDQDMILEHVSKRTWDVVAREVKDVFDCILGEKPCRNFF